jgi:hypothetical protein
MEVLGLWLHRSPSGRRWSTAAVSGAAATHVVLPKVQSDQVLALVESQY